MKRMERFWGVIFILYGVLAKAMEPAAVVEHPVSKFTLQNKFGSDLSDLFAHHLKEQGHLSRRALARSLNEEDEIDLEIEIPGSDSISCRNLFSLGGMCPLSAKVAVSEWTSNGFKTTEKDSTCTSLANREYSCVVSVTNEGIKGFVKSRKNMRSFEFKACENSTSSYCVSFDHDSSKYDDAYKDDMIFFDDEGSEISQTTWELLREEKRRNLAKFEEPDGQINFLGVWDGCYEGVERLHSMKAGFSIGSTMFRDIFESDITNALNFIEKILADVNFIYVQQLHIKIVLFHLEVVHEDASDRPEWDNLGCDMNITSQFSEYREYSVLSNQGIWHLLDACPVNGTVGFAGVGPICSGSGQGIDWHYSSMWKTVAHEIGHNFGAQHSFEEGQGTTGGIMDYGDKTLNGEYQFNKKYRFNDICDNLQEKIPSCIAKNMFFTEGERSICGNGVVELAEECECASGKSCDFCENCLLKKQAECDPLHNECCSENRTFFSGEQACETSEGIGYCRTGVCQIYKCGDFCGVAEDNPCEHKCAECSDDKFLRDGTLCSSEKFSFLTGQCSAGSCVKRTIGLGLIDEGEDSIFPAALAFVAFTGTIAFVVTIWGRLRGLDASTNAKKKEPIVDSRPPSRISKAKPEPAREFVAPLAMTTVRDVEANPMFTPSSFPKPPASRPPSLPLDLQRDIQRNGPKPPKSKPPPIPNSNGFQTHNLRNSFRTELDGPTDAAIPMFRPPPGLSQPPGLQSPRAVAFSPPRQSPINTQFSFNGAARHEPEPADDLRRSTSSVERGPQRPTPPTPPSFVNDRFLMQETPSFRKPPPPGL